MVEKVFFLNQNGIHFERIVVNRYDMKRIVILTGWMLLAVFLSGAQELTVKQRKAQKEQEMRELIGSRQFRFVARAVIPMSGPRVDLTSVYDLKMDSTSVEAWLPFYGRAYHVEYGGRDGGVKFRGEVKEMDVRYHQRKKIYQFIFRVDTDKDRYQVRLSAGLSGYADVSISSNNRQGISYYGIIEPLGKDHE